MADRIGFIGLGRMGRPMAANLSRKGFAPAVYDINPEALAGLDALGATLARSVREVAESSDCVLTMLPDAKAVTEVVFGADGVFQHLKPSGLLMDMSTIDPATTDRLNETADSRGFGFVDAPVGRLASHAERGECLFMAGGTPENFGRVRPLLEAMGTTVHHCGGAGAGTRTKLVNNYLAIVSCQLNAEALALSQSFGLSLSGTLDVLYGTTATNGQLKIAWPAKVLAGDTEPGFTVDLAHKDLTLIVEAANANRVPVPVAAVAREAFSMARASGFGSRDFSSVVDALCDRSGIRRPRLRAETSTG